MEGLAPREYRGVVADWCGLDVLRDDWRVCVTGGREWSDEAFVWNALNFFEATHGQIGRLGHGAARGVDTFSANWSKRAGMEPVPYEADWIRYGDAAGSIRNEEMLDHFKPDVLLVFPGHVGTRHCTGAARHRGIHRVFFNPPGDPLADLLAWG